MLNLIDRLCEIDRILAGFRRCTVRGISRNNDLFRLIIKNILRRPFHTGGQPAYRAIRSCNNRIRISDSRHIRTVHILYRNQSIRKIRYDNLKVIDYCLFDRRVRKRDRNLIHSGLGGYAVDRIRRNLNFRFRTFLIDRLIRKLHSRRKTLYGSLRERKRINDERKICCTPDSKGLKRCVLGCNRYAVNHQIEVGVGRNRFKAGIKRLIICSHHISIRRIAIINQC